ncbi:MAG: HXXEE domain-containing protein [Promethearchaeati archaeon SRVP18_Atabeyarchaeia-1]
MALLDFLNVVTIFWLTLGASVLHVLEEYFGGFVEMMRRYGPLRGITKGVFLLVNAVFIVLCLLAAIINAAVPVYSLSVAALIFINSLIHIGGAARAKGYAAGLGSALFLYIPLSIYAYILYSQAGLLDPVILLLSLLLGAAWMGLAVGYGLAVGRLAKPSKVRQRGQDLPTR